MDLYRVIQMKNEKEREKYSRNYFYKLLKI